MHTLVLILLVAFCTSIFQVVKVINSEVHMLLEWLILRAVNVKNEGTP